MKTYKIISLSTFFILKSLIAVSQNMPWDSTYRPPIYAGKVGQFKSFPKSDHDIIFLGNSIMTYTDWNELLGLKTAKNRGIPGDITFGVLDRLDDVIKGKPAKIFILIGINDITRNIPDSVILNNYKKMITKIKTGSPLTRIYFHTLFPVNDTYIALKGKTGHILNVNKLLDELAKNEKITLINVYPHLLNDKGVLDPLYTFDGLHLNEIGYKIWAKVLKDGNYLSAN